MDKLAISTLNPDVQLFKHQQDFVNRFSKNPHILAAHGTGSGKTLTSIAATESRKADDIKRRPTIIVSPASLRHNYADEGVHQFTNRKAHIIGNRSESPEFYDDSKELPQADYYIMSYEAAKKIGPRLMNRLGADHLIVDEAHFAKNTASGNYKTIKEMRQKAKSSIMMTGTAISNKPDELVTLTGLSAGWNKKQQAALKAMAKNSIRMKPKYKWNRFLKFIPLPSKAGYTYDLDPKFKRRAGKEFQKTVDFLPSESIEGATFPKVEAETIEAPMDPKQYEAYQYLMGRAPRGMAESIRKDLPMAPGQAASVLAKLIKAKQISNYYGVMDPNMDPEQALQHSSKLQAAMGQIKDIQEDPEQEDKRALIFSNLIGQGVDPISKLLSKQNISHGVFAGKKRTSEADRQQAFKDFMAKKKDALVVSSAGQAGLSAKNVPYQLNIDKPMSIGGWQQQMARTIRSGSTPGSVVKQKHFTSVFPKGVPGLTIDQWQDNMLKRKQDLQQAMYKLVKKGAELTTEKRDKLPDSVFALPGRRYPIHDLAHGRAALRLAHHAGKQAGTVRSKVYVKYPELRPMEKKSTMIEKIAAHFKNIDPASIAASLGYPGETPQLLGSGALGDAYKVGNRVMKLTKTPYDLYAADRLLGKKLDRSANIHDIKKIKGTPYHAIMQDYLKGAGGLIDPLVRLGERVKLVPGTQTELFEQKVQSLGQHPSVFKDLDLNTYLKGKLNRRDSKGKLSTVNMLLNLNWPGTNNPLEVINKNVPRVEQRMAQRVKKFPEFRPFLNDAPLAKLTRVLNKVKKDPYQAQLLSGLDQHLQELQKHKVTSLDQNISNFAVGGDGFVSGFDIMAHPTRAQKRFGIEAKEVDPKMGKIVNKAIADAKAFKPTITKPVKDVLETTKQKVTRNRPAKKVPSDLLLKKQASILDKMKMDPEWEKNFLEAGKRNWEHLQKYMPKKAGVNIAELHRELNLQVNREQFSSVLYQAMANYLHKKGDHGIANWFDVQAQEENFHAQKLIAWMNANNYVVEMKQIKKPEKNFASLKNMIQMTIEHEGFITRSLHKIQQMALNSGDESLQKLMKWYMDEQQEEYEMDAELKKDFETLPNKKMNEKLSKRKFKYVDPVESIKKLGTLMPNRKFVDKLNEKTGNKPKTLIKEKSFGLSIKGLYDPNKANYAKMILKKPKE